MREEVLYPNPGGLPRLPLEAGAGGSGLPAAGDADIRDAKHSGCRELGRAARRGRGGHGTPGGQQSPCPIFEQLRGLQAAGGWAPDAGLHFP